MSDEGKWPNGLAEAMRKKGIGPTALARQADTKKQNIDRWAKQQRELTATWAMRLAPLLDTTAAALLLLPDADERSASRPDELEEVMQLAARLTASEQADLVAALLRQRGLLGHPEVAPARKARIPAKSK